MPDVKLKILPDFRNFATEFNRQLKAMKSALGSLGDGIQPIDEAKWKKSINAIDSAAGNVKLDIDATKAISEIESLGQKIKSVDDNVYVDADTTAAGKKLEGLQDQIKASGGKVPVGIDIDRGQLDTIRQITTFDFALNAAQSAQQALSGFADNARSTADSWKILRAQTGATAEVMEKLKSQAAELRIDFGVGDSLADATRALATAQKSLGGFITDGEQGIKEFTVTAAGIAKVFDEDVNKVIQSARPIIQQYGLAGQEAGDLIAYAMQNAGNYQDDVLDTMNEYANKFKAIGLTAQQTAGILARGIEQGAFNTDQIADAAKEYQARLNAGDILDDLSKIDSGVSDKIARVSELGNAGVLTVAETLQQSAALIDEAFKAGEITAAVRDQLTVALSGTLAENIGGEIWTNIFSAPIDSEAIKAQGKKASEVMAAAIEPQGELNRFTNSIETAMSAAAASFSPLITGAERTLTAVSGVAPAFIAFGQFSGPIKNVAGSLVGTLLPGLKNAKGAIDVATVSQKGLNLAIKAAPWGIALAGATALVGGIRALSDALHETSEERLEATKAEQALVERQREANMERQAELEALPKIVQEYKSLKEKKELEGKESEKLKQLTRKLNDEYPGIIKSTDILSDTIDRLAEAESNSRLKLSQLRNELQQLDRDAQRLRKQRLEDERDIFKGQLEDILVDNKSNILNQASQLVFGTSTARQNAEEFVNTYAKEIYSSRNTAELRKASGKFQDAIYEEIDDATVRSQLLSTLDKFVAGQADVIASWSAVFTGNKSKNASQFEKFKSQIIAASSDLERLREVEKTVKEIGTEGFNTGEYDKLITLIGRIRDNYEKQGETAKAAAEKVKKAAEDQAKALKKLAVDVTKYIAESNETQTEATSDALRTRTNLTIEEMRRQASVISSQELITEEQLSQLLELQQTIRDLQLESVEVDFALKGSSQTLSLTRDIAESAQSEINTETAKYNELIKNEKLTSEQREHIRREYHETMSALLEKYTAKDQQIRTTANNSYFSEERKIHNQIAELRSQGQLNEIEDLALRERVVREQELKRTYQKELQLAGRNNALMLDATRKYAAQRAAILNNYLLETNTAYAVGMAFRTSILDEFGKEHEQRKDAELAKDIEIERAKIQVEKETIKSQLDAGEISTREYLARQAELNARDQDARERHQEAMGKSNNSFWDQMRSAAATALGKITQEQEKKLDQQLDQQLSYQVTILDNERKLADMEPSIEQAKAEGKLEIARKLAEDKVKLEDENVRLQESAKEAEEKILQQKISYYGSYFTQQLEATENFGKALGNTAVKFAQKETLAYAYKAAAKALADTPFPLNLVYSAAWLAAGLGFSAAIGKIKFHSGGVDIRKGKSNNEFWAVLEDGESVVEKKATAAGQNKSYLTWLNDTRKPLDQNPKIRTKIAHEIFTNESAAIRQMATDTHLRTFAETNVLARKLDNMSAAQKKTADETKSLARRVSTSLNLNLTGKMKARGTDLESVLEDISYQRLNI